MTHTMHHYGHLLLMRLILIVLFISILTKPWAQDTFIKLIDREETRTGISLVEYEDRIFSLVGGACNNQNECSEVMELDKDGNVLWYRRIPWLDIASKSMVIRNDTISIVSNTTSTYQDIDLLHLNLDGDSLSHHKIVDKDTSYQSIWIQGMVHYNNKWVIAGKGEVASEDTMTSLLYVVDSKGEIDTIIANQSSNQRADNIDVIIDSNNNLNVFTAYTRAWEPDIRIITKYNEDWEVVFSYVSDPELDNFSQPRGAELQDGRIAYVNGHVKEVIWNPGSILDLNSIRVINEDASISWEYKYPDDHSLERELLFIRTLSNGNIIAGGSYSTWQSDPQILNTPFVICLSPEGELLWERAYVEFDADEDAKNGALWNVLEQENGQLLFIGHLYNENRDILLMRTDSEGCVIDSCDPVSEIVGVDDIEAGNEAIHIYPNPITANYINIECTVAQGEHLTAKLYDITGRFVSVARLHDGINTIDIATETSGILVAVIEKNGLVIERKKILRL